MIFISLISRNLLTSFEVSISRFVVTFSIGQSHHFILSKRSIISLSNLFRINFAGFPPTIEYGSTSFTTTEFDTIIKPLPIFIPG